VEEQSFELGRIIGQLTGIFQRLGRVEAGTDQANKEEEVADVFAWLCTLANINNVDIAKAIEKYTVRGVDGFK
jgi:NTP pyrophosphatase (non-canonical NTP hydrolase)